MRRCLLLTLLATAPLACADGCGCDSSELETPVVPTSVSNVTDFDTRVGEDPRSEVPATPPEEAGVRHASGHAGTPAEGSGDVGLPRNLAPNERFETITAPQLQVRPITTPGELPNRIAPHITRPEIRRVGSPPGRGASALEPSMLRSPPDSGP